jgi:ABC-type branched-subunit amino acid transport system substrate-binding protein
MKTTGVDGMVCSCGTSTFVDFLTTMRAEGLTNIKSLSWDPPDTSIFDNSTDTAAVKGSYFLTPQPPLTNPQSLLLEKRLHAVEPSYKVGAPPSYTTFEAYLAMTFVYEGLQLTGSANPTQAEFIKHMQTLKNWTDNGLLPGPIGLNHFGTADSRYCSWFTKVEGTKFVYLNNGKTFCATVPSNL